MDLSWLITIALGAILVYLIYYVAQMNTRYWESRGVVSVYSLPLIGVMFDAVTMRKGFGEILKEIYEKLDGERFGGYFQFTKPVLMLRDPDLINQILIKDFIYFEDRVPNWKGSSDLFSLGIANLTGDEWRTARHKLTPTFTSGKLKMMFDPINQCSDDVVLYLKDNLDCDLNAKVLSLKYIINIIARVAFGLEINTLKDGKDNEFYRVSSKFFKPSTVFLLKLILAMTAPGIRNYFNFKLIDEDVDNFFRKLTKDIIKYRETTGTRRNDFLQLMLDTRDREREFLKNGRASTTQKDEFDDPDDKELWEQLNNTPVGNNNWKTSTELFTDEFIASQTFLFISGGSETTATVLSFVLYELAINKEYQVKVRKEVEDILSTNGFNYQAMKKMTYMEQFINETMRHHPLGGALMRICTKDYKIPGTDTIIDKGTLVSIPVISLHKDPQYFTDPETFNPDRFEDVDAIPKGVYFNFGYGPRICIAMRLAMLEMKIYLAKLLLNFDIVLSEKTKLPLKLMKGSVISNVEGGLWVKFRNRTVNL